MNTLSDYANKRKVGTYFGYPECCIEYFMKKMCDRSLQKKAHKNIMASDGTGFIPCTKHARKILNKEITLCDILCNRECETIFPNDRGVAIEKLRIKRQHFRVMNELQKKYTITVKHR